MDNMKLKTISRAMPKDVKWENPRYEQILLNSLGKLSWDTRRSLALESKEFLAVWQTDMRNLRWNYSFCSHDFVNTDNSHSLTLRKKKKNMLLPDVPSDLRIWALRRQRSGPSYASLSQRKRLKPSRCSVHIIEWNEWKSSKLFGFKFFFPFLDFNFL